MGTSPPRRAKKFWPKGHDAEPDLRRAIDVIPQLVWSAFPDGAVEFCNQPWLEYTGLTAEQAQGWGWKAAIHPEDRRVGRDVASRLGRRRTGRSRSADA